MSNPYAQQGGNGWGNNPQGQQGYGQGPYGAQPQQQGYGAGQYGAQPQQQSYGQDASNPYGVSNSQNPYGGQSSSDPYGASNTQNPYGGQSSSDPYGASNTQNPYGSQGGNAYGAQNQGGYPQGYGQPGMSPMGVPPQGEKSKAPLLIGIVAGIVVLVMIGGLVVWGMLRPSSTSASDPSSDRTSSSSGGSDSGSGSSNGNRGSGSSNGQGSSSGPYSADFSNGVHVEATNIEMGPISANGKKTVVATFVIENRGNEGELPALVVPMANQDGRELELAAFRSGDTPENYDPNIGLEPLPPGYKLTWTIGFEIAKENEPIVFVTTDFKDDNNKIPDYVWNPK